MFTLRLFLCLLLASQISPAARRALLIGVSSYEHLSTLKNPTNDAELVARSLSAVEFEVKVVTNPSHKDLQAELQSFYSTVEDGDITLIYFAGHGIQVGGNNILLAKDADLTGGDAETLTGGIPFSEVLATAESNPAALNVFLLDCCREPVAEGLPPGLATALNISGPVFVGFATAANKLASDGIVKNSPYAEALATALEAKPIAGLTLKEALINTGCLVYALTKKEQKPSLYLDTSLAPVFLVPPSEQSQPNTVSTEEQPTPTTTEPQKWVTASARNISWQPFDKTSPLTLNSLTIRPLSTTFEEGRLRFKCTIKTREAIDFHILPPFAYDRNGQLYTKSQLIDSNSSNYNSGGYSFHYTLKPGEEKDLTFDFLDIPKDLDGFTNLVQVLSINRQELHLPIRLVQVNAEAKTDSLPLSRVQTSYDVQGGISRFERSETTIQATVVLTSPHNLTLQLNHFTAYDEIGRRYLKGRYSLNEQKSATNNQRLNVYLPENQPVAIHLEILEVPEDCAGLTYLRLFGLSDEKQMDFPFRDLPLDASRSEVGSDSLPNLVWRLPLTRDRLVQEEIEFGLRDVTTVDGNTTVNLILVSENAHDIHINSCWAYLSDGTLLTASSAEILGNNYSTPVQSNFRLPSLQPLRYSIGFANIPPEAEGINLLRIKATVNNKKISFDLPLVAIRASAQTTAKGMLQTESPLTTTLASQSQGDFEMKVSKVVVESSQTQITAFLLNKGQEQEITLGGAQAALANLAANETLELGNGLIQYAGQRAANWSFHITLPQNQLLKFKVTCSKGSEKNWNILNNLTVNLTSEKRSQGKRTFTFEDIPLLTAAKKTEGGSALDRLRR